MTPVSLLLALSSRLCAAPGALTGDGDEVLQRQGVGTVDQPERDGADGTGPRDGEGLAAANVKERVGELDRLGYRSEGGDGKSIELHLDCLNERANERPEL